MEDPRLQGVSFPTTGFSVGERATDLLLGPDRIRQEWEALVQQQQMALRLQVEVPDYAKHKEEVARQITEAGPRKSDIVFDNEQGEWVYYGVWIVDRKGNLKQKPAEETVRQQMEQRMGWEDGPQPLH